MSPMIKQLTLVMQSWLAVDPQQEPVKDKEIDVVNMI